jgi:hypothetical protein
MGMTPKDIFLSLEHCREELRKLLRDRAALKQEATDLHEAIKYQDQRIKTICEDAASDGSVEVNKAYIIGRRVYVLAKTKTPDWATEAKPKFFSFELGGL